MLAAVCAAILLAGCRNERQGPPAGGKEAATGKSHSPLVSDAELARLEQQLMQQVAQNRERTCVRPVLRGSAAAGPADRDILALVSPPADHALAPCLLAARERSQDLDRALQSPRPDGGQALLLEACAPFEEALQRAVGHADACSPYLAGRRGLDRLAAVLWESKILVLRMRLLAAQGQAALAARLGLDLLRLTQDLHRGEGAPLIAGMVGLAAARVVLERGLRPLLDTPATLAVLDLEQLERELAILERTEPPFAQMLRYESAGFVLQSILPRIKGKGWTPPGGFDRDSEDGGATVSARKERPSGLRTRPMEGVSEKEQLALVWLVSADRASRMQSACPPGANAVKCHRGLKRVDQAMAAEASKSRLGRIWRVATRDPRREIRDWIMDILKGIGGPSFSRYVARHAERAFFLRALRIHAAVARQRAATGRCPAPAQLSARAGLRLDPASGEPLRIELKDRGLFIRPPATVPADLGSYGALAYFIRCAPR